MADKFSVHDIATLRSNTVLGSSDGIVTTFAIIAGSAGASLSPSVVIVLGWAKLLADAVSMSSGVYLGLRSEIDYQKARGGVDHKHSLLKHALFTFLSFIASGLLPLIPFLLRLENSLMISSVVVFFELFFVGALKTFKTERKWFLGGVEMLLVGGLAASVAFFVGYFFDRYLI